MEVKITKNSPKKTMGVINKITFFLSGIFLTAFTLALLVHFFKEPGIYISFALNGIFIFWCFYSFEKGSIMRQIAAGSIFTVTLMIIAYFTSIKVIETLLANS